VIDGDIGVSYGFTMRLAQPEKVVMYRLKKKPWGLPAVGSPDSR
jgi:hypothetical protein